MTFHLQAWASSPLHAAAGGHPIQQSPQGLGEMVGQWSRNNPTVAQITFPA